MNSGGHRPIFPLLAVLIWNDHGGFSWLHDDAGWFPTIAAAIDSVANPKKTATRGKRMAVRKTTPSGGAQNDHTPKRRRAKHFRN
jgi:hypothetical protein